MFHLLGTPLSDSMPTDAAQAFVAVPQLGEYSLSSDVPQCDPQHDDTPEHAHRVVVLPLAPGGAERVEVTCHSGNAWQADP